MDRKVQETSDRVALEARHDVCKAGPTLSFCSSPVSLHYVAFCFQ